MPTRELETVIRKVRQTILQWDRTEVPDYNEKETRRILIDPVI